MPTSHSSHSTTTISELRLELLDLNHRLLDLFQDRGVLVKKIQEAKAHNKPSYPAYDAVREKELFNLLKAKLEICHPREQLAFSLLMESHAAAPVDYPAWSEGVHLLEIPQRIEHRMNPLMLKLLRPEVFATLRLTPEFSFLRSI